MHYRPIHRLFLFYRPIWVEEEQAFWGQQMGYAEWLQPDSSPPHSSCSCPLMTWPHKNCCSLFRKSAKSKEMKAPSARPVSHHDGKDTSRHRPTQGWTVDEANLLCKVIYILWPSSLGLDGEYIPHPSPRRPNKACTWDICFPLANIIGLTCQYSPYPHRPYQQTRRKVMSCNLQGYPDRKVHHRLSHQANQTKRSGLL